MRVQVLGPVRVWRDEDELDLGPAGQRAVLGLLALACGQPVPRADLVDALWGERPPPSSVNIIQTHIKRLRRLLEPERQRHAPAVLLPAIGAGYALRLAPDRIDLAQFRQLATAAADARRAGDGPRAALLLGQALRLWQGTPLADIPVLAAHPRVVALAGERRSAVVHYADSMIATGAASDALAVLVEAAAAAPLDEGIQACLIRAHQAAGQRARAFAVYRAARRQLADELGVQPGVDLIAAHAALQRDAPDPVNDQPATSQDQPQPPDSTPPRPVPAQLPGDVHGFTGRAAELTELGALLDSANAGVVASPSGQPIAAVVVAVCGTAGVGKTALAVRWAHRVRDQFPDGQLYVNLRGYDPDQRMPAGEALTRFLDALGVAGPAVPLDVDDRAARYRTQLADRRILIVLDNAASVDQVRPLLPGTPSCMVVVTSRDSLPGLVALHGARRLNLEQLPVPDAVALLARLVGPRAGADPEVVAALAERCARLPLALRVAAELATSRAATSLADLVVELTDRQRRLELLDAGGDTRAAVRAVFSWSYQHLAEDARRAFRLLGLPPDHELDVYAVAALNDIDLDRARRLVGVLVRAHLVQPTGPHRFGVHDLLRAYALRLAEQEDPDAERRAALTRLFEHYLATAAAAMDTLYPAERNSRPRITAPRTPRPVMVDPDRARAWLDAERATLAVVCAFCAAADWPNHAVQLATTLYRYLEGGHQTEALTIHTHALDAARRSGDGHGQGHSLTNLGSVYRLLGQYERAIDHYRSALAQHRHNDDPQGEARTLSNLGIVDERLGQHESALVHHQQAVARYRQIEDRYGQASALNNLAAVHEAMGRYPTATHHYRQAIALYQQVNDRTGEAIALANLGIVDERLGHFEQAIEHHQRALALFRQLDHRYGVAATLNNLGDVDTRLGRFERAVDYQRQSLARFRELGHRYGEASALNSLGDALRGAGRAADASTQHASALAIAMETGDRDEQLRAQSGLADHAQLTDAPAHAAGLVDRSVGGHVRQHGPRLGS
jgi:tetratricopeptide (TPR) repeat protein/DNA-binding SARP family transcriptional activator